MDTPQLSCGFCNKPFTAASTGRPPKYCSDACRQSAYRSRKNADERPIEHNQIVTINGVHFYVEHMKANAYDEVTELTLKPVISPGPSWLESKPQKAPKASTKKRPALAYSSAEPQKRTAKKHGHGLYEYNGHWIEYIADGGPNDRTWRVTSMNGIDPWITYYLTKKAAMYAIDYGKP